MTKNILSYLYILYTYDSIKMLDLLLCFWYNIDAVIKFTVGDNENYVTLI